MINKSAFSALLTFLGLFIYFGNYTKAFAQGNKRDQWKIGVAKVKITPKQSMFLAGYGFRDHPSEGKDTELWAKALALEDLSGKKVVIVTADLIRFPKFISDSIRNRLQSALGLSRSQIILNASHTHSGPEVDVTHYRYRVSPAEQQKIVDYAIWLQGQIVQLVKDAFKNSRPGQLYSGSGNVRFAVNRRTNVESKIKDVHELNGPFDHSVPVFKAVDSKGDIKAILFGYSCHATVLAGYNWSADYPGYTQTALESKFPKAVAMFFQGAGGDQNPLPRRSVPLAKQYGRELAVAVERVLEEDMTLLSPELKTTYSEIKLGFAKPVPTREELNKLIADSANVGDWMVNKAKVLRGRLDRGETLITSYPYPVQVWKIGEQPLIALGGEIVADYAVHLKKIFGHKIFLMGYSNDVMEYIPSARVLKEGGYEGSRSPIFTTPWESDIEVKIVNEVTNLADRVGVQRNK
jgi:neutral ceramidase